MTKNEFLRKLSRALRPIDPAEREKSLAYYREMVEDRMEEGASEEDAVASLGKMEDISAELISDATLLGRLRPKRSAASVTLIILGFPLWFPLLTAIAIVILTLYILMWCAVLVLFAVVAALALAGIGAMIFSIITVWTQPELWLLLGLGLVCCGLGLLLALPVLSLAKWLIRETGNLTRKIWNRISNRKAV